jgi:hypothetical protein
MYNIYLNLFIITVDLQSTKKYILSKQEKDISIPRLPLENFNKSKVKIQLSEYIRNIVPMNILGIMPQIISMHSQILEDTYKGIKLYADQDYDSNIECVYGCLVDYIKPVSADYHWIEFSYEIPNSYSANIFEVCQYLQ